MFSKVFSKREATLDQLATLIAVAQEHQDVRQRLNLVLSKTHSERVVELNYWLDSFEQNNAPEEIVSAIRLLLNEEVAEQAKALLRQVD